MTTPRHAVFDPLTGLVSVDYLRTRLGEVYRSADVADTKVSATPRTGDVRLNLTGRTGWDRLTPLVLAGDAMRTVFDGGQTLGRLADHMAVVLAAREPMLARRTHLLAGMVRERLGRDLPTGESIARIWIERLPDTAARRRRPDRRTGPVAGPAELHGGRGDAVDNPGRVIERRGWALEAAR